jgi:hypothetical protein
MKQSIVLTVCPSNNALLAALPRPIRVHVTDHARRFGAENELSWQSQRDPSSGSIHLDPGTTFQEVLGFGAALTDAACYLLDKLPASSREAVLQGDLRSSGDGTQYRRRVQTTGFRQLAMEPREERTRASPCWFSPSRYQLSCGLSVRGEKANREGTIQSI